MNRFSSGLILALLFILGMTAARSQDYRRTQQPVYSPDGKAIVFSATVSKGRDDISKGIGIMAADGTQVRSLTPNTPGVFDEYPSVNADGKTVVFLRRTSNGLHDVYVVNADGSGLKQVTKTPEQELRPEFDHKGTAVVFARNYSSNFRAKFGSLHIVDLATLKEKQILAKEFQVSHAIPAPRGAFFVAAAKLDSDGKPMDVLANGNQITLVSPTGELSPRSPATLPDAGAFIDRIQSARGTEFMLYATGNVIWPDRAAYLITAKGVEKFPDSDYSLSPDGAKLMSWEQGSRVYVKGIREERGVAIGTK